MFRRWFADSSDSTVTDHAENTEAQRIQVIRRCSAPFDWSACRAGRPRRGESVNTNRPAIEYGLFSRSHLKMRPTHEGEDPAASFVSNRMFRYDVAGSYGRQG